MGRDDFDRHIARERRGIYESHYLKANSPDGHAAFWIKHNLLVLPDGDAGTDGGGLGEFWLIWFQRGERPRVWKREVPVAALTLRDGALGLDGDRFHFDGAGCKGAIAGAAWQLAYGGGIGPLFHFGSPRLYRGSFPKKKLLTPAPNLRFDGHVQLGERRVAIAGWLGMRGHNWGSEHAYSYAYGSCNQWDDGAGDRAIDGFTARIRLGPVLSPWLSSLVYRDGGKDTVRNRYRDWVNRGAIVEPARWVLPYRGLALTMEGRGDEYAGLRYRHPSGRESYCYNTKFAATTVEVGGTTHTSGAGEHEVLYPSPLPGIALHPSEGWSQARGDYAG